ncbi:MAG: putative quinol monooxygenase [Ferruginibacter sp.]
MKNLPPIHVFATWKVKEGQIENVLNILKTVGEESVKEKGNLFYKIHQSNTDINTLVLFEGYTDETAITEHRNSAHYKDLVIGKIIPLLENREVILTTPVE